MLRRLYDRLLSVWRLALREQATPRGIAWAVGVGAFVGCTPFLGLHAGLAVVVATLFRLNRLWALVGSRISFFLVLPWIALAEIQTAHHLRTGSWAPLFSQNVMEHAGEWLLDWFAGTFLVGGPLAVAVAFLAYALARARARASERRGSTGVTPRTPAPAPPPSSGSRP